MEGWRCEPSSEQFVIGIHATWPGGRAGGMSHSFVSSSSCGDTWATQMGAGSVALWEGYRGTGVADLRLLNRTG